MHPIEYKLLSLLKHGETLRIILSRLSGERRFSIALAADGLLGRPSADLTRRLSILLDALRGQGIEYALQSQGELLDVGARTWLDIVPRSRDLTTAPDGKLGFGHESAVAAGKGRVIRVPALGAVPAPDLVLYSTEFLDKEPQVEVVCLSFARMELENRWERLLADSLDMKFSELMAVIGREAAAVSMQKFLALWLVRKSGWEINLRAAIRPGRKVPRAALELLGREVFDTECEVRGASAAAKGRPADLDLSSRYPDGWQFPRLLPPRKMLDRMNLARLHNPSLPDLPRSGVLIGDADGEVVRLPEVVRDRHTYVVGATGTGKSTLLFQMIQHDMEHGDSVVLLDPHGDLYAEVLDNVPAGRRRDVVTINPNSTSPPIGLNVLDVPRDEIFGRRVDFVVGELISFFKDTWDVAEAFGPMFETYFRNTIMLMMHQPGDPLTLLEFEKVLVDEAYRKALCGTCTQTSVAQFWLKNAGMARGEANLSNIAPYIACKVGPLMQADFMGRMLGNRKDELCMDQRLDKRCILLVNLNKGMLSPLGSSLLGSLLTMQIFAAGLKRSLRSRHDRPPVNVYIDEFQNFVSENIASLFSEARKFGLRVHVANQHLGQLHMAQGRQKVLDSILGNVGNMIMFRLGVMDAERLEKFCEPVTRKQMQELPNFHALARLQTGEGPIRPFIMKTLVRG